MHDKYFKKSCIISQCYILVIMCYFAIFLSSSFMSVLSATQSLIIFVKKNETVPLCSKNMSKFNAQLNLTQTYLYEWNSNASDLIENCLRLGFISGEIFGGIISTLYNSKYFIIIPLSLQSFACFFIPTLIGITEGNWEFIAITSFVLKFLYGFIHASIITILGQWILPKQKTIICTIPYSACYSGTALGFLTIDRFFATKEKWDQSFYLYGSLGIILSIFWQFLCYSSPDKHPHMQPKQRNLYLNHDSVITEGNKKIPWLSIITSRPVWALMFATVGLNWAWITLNRYFQYYLVSVSNLKPTDPFIINLLMFQLISISGAIFSDYLRTRKIVSTTTMRKIVNNFGCMGVCIFMVVASFGSCNESTSTILYVAADFCMGFYYCNVVVNVLDLSPNFAGVLMAINFSMATITELLIMPSLVGYVLQEITFSRYRILFFVCLAVGSLTTFIYSIFAEAKKQRWNKCSKP